MKTILKELAILLLIFMLPSSLRAEEAATYLRLNPYGIKIRLAPKGSGFFIGLTRNAVKLRPEGTDKVSRILMAKSFPYVLEINDDCFAVTPEGFVSCATGELLSESEEGWRVLTSPGSLSGMGPWANAREDFDKMVGAIENHHSVQKAPVIVVDKKPTKGIFHTFNRSAAYCECGVLFEELVRATLRESPVDVSESLRNLRLADSKLLIDGILFAWQDNYLIELTSGNRYSHPKGYILKCSEEFSMNEDMTRRNEVAGAVLGFRAIERVLIKIRGDK